MKLSIIIPTLNEEAVIEKTLKLLKQAAPAAELLVVDGGSTDETVKTAASLAKVISTPPGRAVQLNRGAEVATGDWLLFIHADSIPPRKLNEAITQADQQGLKAGTFSLAIQGHHPMLPLLALGANLRTRFSSIFLGDQGCYIQKDLFHTLAGFPPLPLMEDYAFALNLKKAGVRIMLSPQKMSTSGRRWETQGFFRTWFTMRRNYFHFNRSGVSEKMIRQYSDIR